MRTPSPLRQLLPKEIKLDSHVMPPTSALHCSALEKYWQFIWASARAHYILCTASSCPSPGMSKIMQPAVSGLRPRVAATSSRDQTYAESLSGQHAAPMVLLACFCASSHHMSTERQVAGNLGRQANSTASSRKAGGCRLKLSRLRAMPILLKQACTIAQGAYSSNFHNDVWHSTMWKSIHICPASLCGRPQLWKQKTTYCLCNSVAAGSERKTS